MDGNGDVSMERLQISNLRYDLKGKTDADREKREGISGIDEKEAVESPAEDCR